MAHGRPGPSAPHSRRGLLVALAGGLLPSARPAAAKKPKKGKSKKKYKTITKRFTLSGFSVVPGSISLRIASETDLPAGKIVSIAVTLSALFADQGNYLNVALYTRLPDDTVTAQGILLSDVGAGEPIVGASVTLASDSKRQPPRIGQLTSGTYRPTNIDEVDEDVYRLQFPPTGFGQLLGTPPQGEWRIQILNDGSGNIVVGVITLTLKMKVRVRR